MRKLNNTIYLVAAVVVFLIGCSKESLPKPPIESEILQDAEQVGQNIYLGYLSDKDKPFTLSPLVLEDAEVTLLENTPTINAEVTAYLGDDEWISNQAQTFTVQYVLNSGSWQLNGLHIDDPVINVIAR
ncbi:hypothetical protein M3231_06935 [Neobacillus mesonae]|nr:hypothetical protein [Neobacillus mesonae]